MDAPDPYGTSWRTWLRDHLRPVGAVAALVVVVAVIAVIAGRDDDPDRERTSTAAGSSTTTSTSTASTSSTTTVTVPDPMTSAGDEGDGGTTPTVTTAPMHPDVSVPPDSPPVAPSELPPGFHVARDHGPAGLSTDVSIHGCSSPLELDDPVPGVRFDSMGNGLGSVRFLPSVRQGTHDLVFRCGSAGAANAHAFRITGPQPRFDATPTEVVLGQPVTLTDRTGCGEAVPGVLLALWWASEPGDEASVGSGIINSIWTENPTPDATGRWPAVTSAPVPTSVPQGARYLWVSAYCQDHSATPGYGWAFTYAFKWVRIAGT